MEIINKMCYTLYKKIDATWSYVIKQLKNKHKLWLETKRKKEMRKRSSKNARRKRFGAPSHSTVNNKYGTIDGNTYTAKAPSCLSIYDNCEDTLDYFNDIFSDMYKKIAHRNYYFDVSEVKHITSDAIMYILAIVYCIKMNFLYHFGFSGNDPKDENARRLFHESGFFNYVNSRSQNMPDTSDKLQILSGKESDGVAASKIIEFVRPLITKESKELTLKALYRILIELMSNTANHAYKHDEGIMKKNWYIFAERSDGRIKFVFLDTGLGIPATIRKWGLYELVGLQHDENLILCAFTQNFRSKTKQANRGYGLPTTYDICKRELLKKFTVISGKGYCEINSDKDIIKPVKNKIHGTVYYWEVCGD